MQMSRAIIGRIKDLLFSLRVSRTVFEFEKRISEAARSLTERVQLSDAYKAIGPSSAGTDFLPIHFFTIVLNGEPFIRYHERMLAQLPMRWHWHIVEGVAELNHDTAWAARNGGRIPGACHKNGLSIDGTSEYLDDLKQRFPDRVSIYRKPRGEFWDGKREMVTAPLSAIQEDCLLWQVDSDELWMPDQIVHVRNVFANNPERTAAFYWCY